jgi:hypothetical protein
MALHSVVAAIGLYGLSMTGWLCEHGLQRWQLLILCWTGLDLIIVQG